MSLENFRTEKRMNLFPCSINFLIRSGCCLSKIRKTQFSVSRHEHMKDEISMGKLY